MLEEAVLNGTSAPTFEPVRDAFRRIAAEETGLSAQLCIYHRGTRVVDLWTGPDMTADSLTAVYSVSKGAAYLVVALLIQDGLIDPDAPVSTYWPELVAAKDPSFTVADLLGHKAGLIGVDAGFTLEEVADDRAIAARLESQQPYWEPGSAHGYHALTNGALAGEIARRVTGSTLQELFETRIRSPHAIDFYLGLPIEHEDRYLTVQPPVDGGDPPLPEPGSLYAIAMNFHAAQPTSVYNLPNDRLIREKGQSSAAGIGSARGLGRMYAAAIGLEGGEPLLNEATIATITTPQESGLDMVFGFESRFLLGFADLHASNPALSPRTFGHNGAVGSLAFADPDAGLAYGYTRRRFLPPHKETDVDNAALILAMTEAARSA